jgi:hypothetical protein
MDSTPEPVTSAERLATRLGELTQIGVDVQGVRLWLTEYWSTALPLPTVDGHQPDQTGLRLQVWCTTPDEFAAARTALGRGLDGDLEVRHVTLGTGGNTTAYAQVTRAFGAVDVIVVGIAANVDPEDGGS